MAAAAPRAGTPTGLTGTPVMEKGGTQNIRFLVRRRAAPPRQSADRRWENGDQGPHEIHRCHGEDAPFVPQGGKVLEHLVPGAKLADAPLVFEEDPEGEGNASSKEQGTLPASRPPPSHLRFCSSEISANDWDAEPWPADGAASAAAKAGEEATIAPRARTARRAVGPDHVSAATGGRQTVELTRGSETLGRPARSLHREEDRLISKMQR